MWLANVLESLADGAVTCMEIVISDHFGKRPRRSHRIITRRVYHRAPATIYHVHYHPHIASRRELL
jgi:hypothetical protein